MGQARVQLRYWAGARAAAGVENETYTATTIADALAQARSAHDQRFASVLAMSSLLVDGTIVPQTRLKDPLDAAIEVEVLPPFAGGSSYNARSVS